MLENRPSGKISLVYETPNNPLENILMTQSSVLGQIVNAANTRFEISSSYQKLCLSAYANSCHTFMSIIILIKKLNLPNRIDQTTALTVPTDMLKPIAGLIRPLFEVVSLLKFINKCFDKLSVCDSDIIECKNDIARQLYNLSLYDAEFQGKWQTIFDEPTRKRDKNKPNHARIVEILENERRSISEELDKSFGPCRNSLMKQNSYPKDIWKFVKEYFEKRGLDKKDINHNIRYQIAWSDEHDELYIEMVNNLKLGNLTNPWNGDPNEYETKVSPRIAFKRLINDYTSQALHFDPKYLFQDTRSKNVNIFNLWSVICLALPEIMNELINLYIQTFEITDVIRALNYDYDKLKDETSLWAGSVSQLLIKRIMEGY